MERQINLNDRITKYTLLELNKKEMEDLFNSKLEGCTFTSTSPSEVKEEMIKHLKKYLKGLDVKIQDYLNNTFLIAIGKANITIKVSAKSTGEIVPVSKLRNKILKTVGKFTISEINYDVNYLCYEFADKSAWKMQIQKDWVTDGDGVYFTKFDIPLKEAIAPENLIKKINEAKKGYADSPFSRGPYRNFVDELKLSMAQPILKSFFYTYSFDSELIKKEQLRMIPEPHFSQLPNEISMQNLFELIIQIVGDINAELVDDVIKNKTF